ncbi:MAG: CZB domain-containing protein [Sulfuriferula sp.]|nr:CZB domain-containing protein [Sulfuriferula sp.]
MNKLHIIERLRESKKAHVAWVSHAHSLVEGLAVDGEKLPVHGTECGFGCWYYGDGQFLSSLPVFRAIEEPHLALHDLYLQIYKHMQVRKQEDDSSVLGRLFGSNKELLAKKIAAEEQISTLFMRLKVVSKEVSNQLDTLADQVVAMSDADFNALLHAQGMKNDTSVLHFKRAS